MRGALAVLAVCLGLLAWASFRAALLDTPAAAALADSSGLPPAAARRELFPARRILASVDKDPFHPERRRPGQRFQIPSNAPPADRAAERDVRVVGTAVGPNGGFAMLSFAGGTPRIVRVGDRLGQWTLSKVTPGAAEFTGTAGSTMVVRVAKAGT